MNKIFLEILTFAFVVLLGNGVLIFGEDCRTEVIPGKVVYIIRNYETGNCLATISAKNTSDTLSMAICDLNNANLYFYFFDRNKIKHFETGLCLTATPTDFEKKISSPEVALFSCDTDGKSLAASQTWFEHNRYNSFTAMWTTWKADTSPLRLTTNISFPYTPFLSSYDYWNGKQLWKFEGVPSCQNMSPGDIP